MWVLPGEIVFAFLPGVIFLVVAIGQGPLGVRLLFGPGAWAVRLGMLFNLSVAFVWVLTRLVVLPNVTGTVALEVDLLGLTATVVEMALAILLVVYARL